MIHEQSIFTIAESTANRNHSLACIDGAQMKLYHGTSSRHLDAILRKGLLPRKGRRTFGNWKHSSPSNPAHVYLTTAYAIHFGLQATLPNSIIPEEIAIIEIDSDRLNPWRLHPDEDFLAHAITDPDQACKHSDAPAQSLPVINAADFDNLQARTLFYRDNIDMFQSQWENSIKWLGTCSHESGIDPKAFTRYSLVPKDHPLRWLSDPSITLANYKLMGGFYRALTAMAFGDEFERDHVLTRHPFAMGNMQLADVGSGKVTTL